MSEVRPPDEPDAGTPGEPSIGPPGQPSANPSPVPADPPSPSDAEPTVETRSLYRHPLAGVGGAIMVAGSLMLLVLVAIDMTSGGHNTYRSLVTYVAMPSVVLMGAVIFLLAIRRQVMNAKRRGQKVQFTFRVEPSNPRYMRSLWVFLGVGALVFLVVGWSGFKGYEATDSVAFCGQTCHKVMKPEAVTYEHSPHARVLCVECHIGSGTSFWVRSKIDGMRQVVATLTNSYPRPIPTPVENLRPAQQTCETCHWPNQFYGRKLVTRRYYRTDQQNSPWTISLLVNIGGSNTRTGSQEGIHWHMLIGKKIEYLAADEKRQVIPWVRVTRDDGTVTVYKDPSASGYPDPDDPETEFRVFDCMDCHNRPSHLFLPPAVAINQELARGTISTDLPYVRRVGLDLLNTTYTSQEEAAEKIRSTLLAYYEQVYPDRVDELRDKIEAASDALIRVYENNFFPTMKTDYRSHLNNLSHFVNVGCFRCHGSDKVSDTGEKITGACDTCHTIVAQGPSTDTSELDNDLLGLEFQHPVDIGKQWQEIRCTDCHTPQEGY
ncbi:MAG: cytochrome C [Gammaproteobacteria bacterium]|nr:cytochrome C [Gammaproteobacteria bacterium]